MSVRELAPREASTGRGFFWVVMITGVAQFMAALDNLVVTMALPVIRERLHTGLSGLEWTVNAYTLTFAVLLLTGAALGDRFGRRRVFLFGLTLFTAASAAAAMAPNISFLIAARAAQGAGGAVVMPLALTLLSAGVPASRRNAALGIFGALAGLAIGIGPLIGGAIVQSFSWQWIFWCNVPIGLCLIPLARFGLSESRGPRRAFDVPGVLSVTVGLFGLVLGLVRGNSHGWTSTGVLSSFAVGVIGLAFFFRHELRTETPMLPLRMLRQRQFGIANLIAALMSFGMFGSVFLLAQFLQTVQHYSPVSAGLRTLPWTAMPLVISPLAGALAERIGPKPLLVVGLGLQATGLAWLAAVMSVDVSYGTLIAPFVVCGVGMALFWVPVLGLVLGSVDAAEQGIASGVNNALRELGGVFGIAVLGSVFSATGGYASGSSFVHGVEPAVFAGAAVVACGFVASLLLPKRRTAAAVRSVQREPELELSEAV